MTDAEIQALSRQNALWRQVRPDEDVAANLERLRQAGAEAAEVAALEPRLAEIWEVPFERNFGWLHEGTVERVREIDRQFIMRMRATRLYRATGVRAGGEPPPSVAALNRLWRRAILKALDYDEVAEFRLMNSGSAREEMQRVEGLVLTGDEIRTLFVWRREYEGRRIPAMPDANLSAAQQEDRFDEWRRKRHLLGDERFARYLEREHPGFAGMQRALGKINVIDPTAALDLWWLRQKEGFVRNQEPRVAVRDEMTTSMRRRAREIMGEERLAEYGKDPDSRWIVIPERPNQRRPRAAVTSPAQSPATDLLPGQKAP